MCITGPNLLGECCETEPRMAAQATCANSFRSVTKESYVTRVRNAPRAGEGGSKRDKAR